MTSTTSSAEPPQGPVPTTPDDVPGKPLSASSMLLDKGSAVIQSLKPIKQIQQHVCTFAMYSHDMSRQIETHHYVSRLNEDFLQCLVYDNDDKHARLIGVEYIVSERLFVALPEEEKKLWHSHFHEIRTGLWVNPGVPEIVQKQELKKLAPTYGKFWCTWQFDRGDRLPLGPPALMMSPQPECEVHPDLVKKRDEKYNISTREKSQSHADVGDNFDPHPSADRWKQSKQGFVVELKEVDVVLPGPSPASTLQVPSSHNI
ncbi:hypothetical protein O6H91_01G112500 [Diphasiastrum complanatum]|uniref:Uncharacterized protein n=1 Tax=Diphasiastrum complanatum TaxID=34168 RepID=A0ACC2EUW7_DIPCM|nr:hypothetical protein O6H91_01G112500 [Diphasiastrum complanatum]